jgi:hypothetical protein
VLLHVDDPGEGPLESPGLVLRLESLVAGSPRHLEAEFPRPLLQRLVLGREVDLTPAQPLPGLSPLPGSLGDVSSVMVLPRAARWRAPWENDTPPRAGEEDPVQLARALGRWWASVGEGAPAAIIGVDPGRSPERWQTAPRPDRRTLLLLPSEAFVGPMSGWREELAGAWGPDTVVDALPDDPRGALVILVGAEPPASFARRLRELARDERMRGRLLAAWSLAGPVREDLPRSLLDEGQLAGIGLVEDSLVARRRAAGMMDALRRALAEATDADRVENLPGPFLWYF